jgi:hypothetical protein
MPNVLCKLCKVKKIDVSRAMLHLLTLILYHVAQVWFPEIDNKLLCLHLASRRISVAVPFKTSSALLVPVAGAESLLMFSIIGTPSNFPDA